MTNTDMKYPIELKPWMRKRIRSLRPLGAGTERLTALSALSKSEDAFVDTDFVVHTMVEARQRGNMISFPRPLLQENDRTILRGYLESMFWKYQAVPECRVAQGDVVVDCGAYVGGFGRSVAGLAKTLLVIEPAPDNVACCRANLSGFANAHILQAGLFDKTGTLALNLSDSSVDHSFLSPDRGDTGETLDVPIYRLDDLAVQQGLAKIDFFKLEAEGAEIEAILGMGDLRPNKIAIDAGPERYGESPMPELTDLLNARGYETQSAGNTLFAWLAS